MIELDFKLDYALLHLNYNCNLSCEHCRVLDQEKSKTSMSYELATSVIDQFSELKVPLVTFTGGEPTIYKRIIELIGYGIKKGLNVRLQTNFANIDENFLMQFYGTGGRLISISIDGLEQTHDSIRGKKGLFAKIIKLISNYSHIISFQVDFVLSKDNYHEIYPLIDLLRSIGVKIFSFRSVVPITGKNTSDRHFFSKKELYDIYNAVYCKSKEIINLKIISPDPLYSIFSIRDKKINIKKHEICLGGCSIGLGFLSIQPNADVLMCTFINNPIGNLQTENLKSIIEKINESEQIRKLVLREDIKTCSTCNYKYLCGGCRARALQENCDLFGVDPLCFKDEFLQKDN